MRKLNEKIAIKEKMGIKGYKYGCVYDHLTSDCNIIGCYRLLCITKLCVLACRCREETEINLLKRTFLLLCKIKTFFVHFRATAGNILKHLQVLLDLCDIFPS